MFKRKIVKRIIALVIIGAFVVSNSAFTAQSSFVDKLATQTPFNPVDSPELFHKFLIETSIKCVLDENDIHSFNVRYVPPSELSKDVGIAIDFSPPEDKKDGKKYGKVKIGEKWHVPCFITYSTKDLLESVETHYEAVIGLDNSVESIYMIEDLGFYKKEASVMLCYLGDERDGLEVDEPLSIGTLAGTLRQSFGSPVKTSMVHYLSESGVDGVIERIKKEKPDILGLSLFFSTLEKFEKIMRYINSIPGKDRPIVVVGNVLAKYNAEFLLDKYPDIIVCTGEGENTIKEVVKHYRGEMPKTEISNIAYKQEGKTRFNRFKRVDIGNARLPARDILSDVLKSGGIVYLETSRGCPYNCTICARNPFLGRGWHGFSLDYIMEDLVEICKQGVKFAILCDEDTFAGGSERIMEMANRILELKKTGKIPEDFTFSASSSARSIYREGDDIGNKEREVALKKIVEAGMTSVYVGLESGSPEQLRRYGKAATVLENEKALEIIGALNLYITPGFIMFDPLVTVDDLKKNIAFLRRTGMDKRSTYPIRSYIPMKGSRYTQRLINLGLVREEEYDQNTQSYEYSYAQREVADILVHLKAWEESQQIFLYRLKTLYRSSRFRKLGAEKRSVLEKILAKQTVILIDYLEDLVNTKSDAEREKVSQKYSNRLMKDMIEGLDEFAQKIDLKKDIENLTNFMYRGVVREVIRLHCTEQDFSIQDVCDKVESKISKKLDFNKLRNTLDDFVTEKRLTVSESRYAIADSFWEYREIYYNDLPRPAKEMSATFLFRDITRPEELALDTRDAIVSIATMRKIVLAFNKNIRSEKALQLLHELNELKKDKKLKDRIVIITASPEDLPGEIEKEMKKGKNDVYDPVGFMFSPETDKDIREIQDIVKKENVQSVFIGDEGFPPDCYYPLIDIVAITLKMYASHKSVDDLLAIFRSLKIDCDELNIDIKNIEQDKKGSLIFPLLPNAKEYGIDKLPGRSTRLREALKHA